MSLYQSNPLGLKPGFVPRRSCPNCGSDMTIPENRVEVPGQAARCRKCHNARNAKSAQQYTSGEMSKKAKLTQAQVTAIRRSKKNATELSQEYGVARKTIYAIRSGRTWR